MSSTVSSLKLQNCFDSLKDFITPQIRLEQYPTSAALTASIVSFALKEGDLGPGRTALDLGCGTGMLAMGCAVVDCDVVWGVDCDPDAVAVAVANAEHLNVNVDFILAKVNDGGFVEKKEGNHNRTNVSGRGKSKSGRGPGRGGRANRGAPQAPTATLDPNAPDGLPLLDGCVDTVVTNPPFGTKHNAGMDVRFLKAGTRLARRAVYSFHKTSTRDYLLKTISAWGFEARVVAELKFDIPATYKFHNKANVDVAVDLIRVAIGGDGSDDKQDEPDVGGDGSDDEQDEPDEVEGGDEY